MDSQTEALSGPRKKYHRMRDCLEDLNGDAEMEILSCVGENFLKLRLWQDGARAILCPCQAAGGGRRVAAEGLAGEVLYIDAHVEEAGKRSNGTKQDLLSRLFCE